MFGLRPSAKPLAWAAVLLGIGLGGFVDGILLHQILQWHHMASSHPDPAIANDLRLNVTLDGFFHVAAWAFLAVGLVALQRGWRRADVPRSGRVLAGGLLFGWGVFNLVEGIVDHHLLALHHVHPSEALAWDLAFLVFGALLLVGGWALARSDEEVRAKRRDVRDAPWA